MDASKIDPLLPWAAGCQMVALNFQQVNLLFSYYGSAVSHGYRLSAGGSQFPTGQPLLFISWIRCYPGLPDVRWRLSTSNKLTSASIIFSWIRGFLGLQAVRWWLSVSNRLPLLLIYSYGSAVALGRRLSAVVS